MGSRTSIDAGSAGVCWISFKLFFENSKDTESQKRHGAYFIAKIDDKIFYWRKSAQWRDNCLFYLPEWVTSCGDSIKISSLLKYCSSQIFRIWASDKILDQHESSAIFVWASIHSAGWSLNSWNNRSVFLNPWSKKNFSEWSIFNGANLSKTILVIWRSFPVRGIVYSHQSFIGCARPNICFTFRFRNHTDRLNFRFCSIFQFFDLFKSWPDYLDQFD